VAGFFIIFILWYDCQAACVYWLQRWILTSIISIISFGIMNLRIFDCMLILNRTAVIFLMLFSACNSVRNAQRSVSYSTQVIDRPVIFAEGVISTKEASEFDICFTPDGKTAFFTRRAGSDKQKIWQAEFQNGVWKNSVQSAFSTDRDETPFLSPDGKTLYFGSARPIEGRPSRGNFDMNIWHVEWTGNQWGNPSPLNADINSVQQEKEEWPSSNENFIFSLDNKNFIYSTMRRSDKAIEIYKTTKNGDAFTQPEKITGLFTNEKSWKYSAVISPDGQYLLFNSYEAEGGTGGEDIFIAKKTAEGWTKAKNIGNLVNTKAEESSPRFSPDGKYFFFGREYRENPNEDGIWNIYFLETAYLHFETLFNN
jgi:Tol biopolymer transport system component